jgi:predicted small lipoprotein YifL
MRNPAAFLVVTVAAALTVPLAGCGQKGPLFLPQKTSTVIRPTGGTPATAPATDPATGAVPATAPDRKKPDAGP